MLIDGLLAMYFKELFDVLDVFVVVVELTPTLANLAQVLDIWGVVNSSALAIVTGIELFGHVVLDDGQLDEFLLYFHKVFLQYDDFFFHFTHLRTAFLFVRYDGNDGVLA